VSKLHPQKAGCVLDIISRRSPEYNITIRSRKRFIAVMRDSNLYTLLIRPSNIPAETATSSSHTDIIHLVERRDGSEEPRYTRVKKRVDEERIAKGVDPGAYEAELLGTREKVVGQGKGVVDRISPWFYYTDAYTGAKLASVSATNHKAKNKKIQLHSPDVVLGYESTGTL
jgi:hypothetical protein